MDLGTLHGKNNRPAGYTRIVVIMTLSLEEEVEIHVRSFKMEYD